MPLVKTRTGTPPAAPTRPVQFPEVTPAAVKARFESFRTEVIEATAREPGLPIYLEELNRRLTQAQASGDTFIADAFKATSLSVTTGHRVRTRVPRANDAQALGIGGNEVTHRDWRWQPSTKLDYTGPHAIPLGDILKAIDRGEELALGKFAGAPLTREEVQHPNLREGDLLPGVELAGALAEIVIEASAGGWKDDHNARVRADTSLGLSVDRWVKPNVSDKAKEALLWKLRLLTVGDPASAPTIVGDALFERADRGWGKVFGTSPQSISERNIRGYLETGDFDDFIKTAKASIELALGMSYEESLKA